MRTVFLVIFWGKQFRDVFLKYVLPSHISERNIPDMALEKDSEYVIYTTASDEVIIKSTRVYRQLLGMMRVRFVRIDGFLLEEYLQDKSSAYKYEKWRRVCNYAFKREYVPDSILFHPPPDTVYADGTLAKAYSELRNGKSVALIHEPRVSLEAFIGKYGDAEREGNGRNIKSREMVDFALGNLHPRFLNHFVDSEYFCKQPTILYWRVSPSCMLVRSFNYHPLAVRLRDELATFDQAIDFDYINFFIKDPEKIYVASDSDEMFGMQLTSVDIFKDTDPRNKFDVDEVISKLKEGHFCTPFHVKLFGLPGVIHSKDVADEPLFEQVKKQSSDIACQLYDLGLVGFGQDQEVPLPVAPMPNPKVIRPSFHFANVVWGELYTKRFLDYSLPTTLSPYNIPGLRDYDVEYHLYCPRREMEIIQAHPSYQLLQATVKCILHELSILPEEDRYKIMNACHCESIKMANKTGATIVFLFPDMIMAEGTMMEVATRIQNGAQAVMMPGLRLNADTFLSEFLGDFAANKDGSISVSSCDVMRLGFKHMHPWTNACFHDAVNASRTPAVLYWRLNEEAILGRCFHLHPLAVKPCRLNVLPKVTMDGDYIAKACKKARVEVIEDSRDGLILEFSDSSKMSVDYLPGHRHSPRSLANWGRLHADAIHRRLLGARVVMRSSSSPSLLESEAARSAIAHSDFYVKKTYSYLHWSHTILKYPAKMISTIVWIYKFPAKMMKIVKETQSIGLITHEKVISQEARISELTVKVDRLNAKIEDLIKRYKSE